MDYSKSLEMYLKEIYILSGRAAKIRTTDVANLLGVSKASVNYAVKRLCKNGMLSHKVYKNIEITKLGISQAREICKRQEIIAAYFSSSLGINAEDARKEACRLQYALSDTVIDKMKKATEKQAGQK